MVDRTIPEAELAKLLTKLTLYVIMQLLQKLLGYLSVTFAIIFVLLLEAGACTICV